MGRDIWVLIIAIVVVVMAGTLLRLELVKRDVPPPPARPLPTLKT